MSLATAFQEKAIDFEGKQYTLKGPTFRTCGYFEHYLNEEAVKQVEGLFAGRPSYKDAMREVMDRIFARAWEWKSPGFAAALNSHRHFQRLLLLLLQQSHAGEPIGPDLIERMLPADPQTAEDAERVRQIVEAVYSVISRPNFQGPAAATGAV